MEKQVDLSPTRIEVNSLGNVFFRSGTEIIGSATVKDKVHLSGLSILVYKVDTPYYYRLNIEGLVQIVLADATLFEFDALVVHQSSTKQATSKTKVLSVFSRLLTSIFNGGCCVTSGGEGGDCVPNNVLNSLDEVVSTLVEGDTVKAMTANITIAKVGTQVQMTSSAEEVINYPSIISHRKPTYTTENPGDYPTLFTAGYFDILYPSVPVRMVQLGADNFTLAVDNKFGNTSRYTATDGTPSDTGTARFSSYGSGVANVVIDHYLGIMWYNLEISGSITWDNAQTFVDPLNSALLAGYSTWIRPTRDIITISAMPDNNQESYLSPNLIISDTTTSLRRLMTCELAASAKL